MNHWQVVSGGSLYSHLFSASLHGLLYFVRSEIYETALIVSSPLPLLLSVYLKICVVTKESRWGRVRGPSLLVQSSSEVTAENPLLQTKQKKPSSNTSGLLKDSQKGESGCTQTSTLGFHNQMWQQQQRNLSHFFSSSKSWKGFFLHVDSPLDSRKETAWESTCLPWNNQNSKPLLAVCSVPGLLIYANC